MPEWILLDDDRTGKMCFARPYFPGQHGGRGKVVGVYRIKGGKRIMMRVHLNHWGNYHYPEGNVKISRKRKKK